MHDLILRSFHGHNIRVSPHPHIAVASREQVLQISSPSAVILVHIGHTSFCHTESVVSFQNGNKLRCARELGALFERQLD